MSENEEDTGGKGSGDTKSTKTRHPYTNDLAALGLVFGTLFLMAAAMSGYADPSALPQDIRLGLWIPSVLIAVAWLFGGAAVDAATKVVNGGN